MVSIWFVIVTLAFAAGIPRVEIKTVFADLLPQDDEFVKIYNAHPNFGNPLTMFVMVKRKNGDIYHADTLQKVWDLTRNIDLTEGVDHDQIISISTEKLRYVEATPQGVDVRPLMGDAVPKDQAEVDDFRRRVAQSFRSVGHNEDIAGYALAKRGLSVVVLEKEKIVGQGVSSRNSEVIHAGLYYPTGTKRAVHCPRSRRLAGESCTRRPRRSVPCRLRSWCTLRAQRG